MTAGHSESSEMIKWTDSLEKRNSSNYAGAKDGKTRNDENYSMGKVRQIRAISHRENWLKKFRRPSPDGYKVVKF